MEAQSQRQGLVLKQKKSGKQRFEKRSPLQNLNALHFPKSYSNITSNSYSASAEARNGCLHSSNSSSDASLVSSFLRTRLERKPKSLPKVGSNFSVKSFRTKENELPRKLFSEKPKKKQQLCFDGTIPRSKTAQISKLSSGRGNVMKKGYEELEGKKLRRCRVNGLSELPLKSSTPVGSSVVRRNAAEESGSRTANGGNGSATSVKTPPVEVSMSREIQSKMVVLKSAATPVCYGAGHLLSGVTDKRKCRRRGSLRGGCEKVNLFNEVNDENVVGDLRDPLIPLPSEASVRWLLSPCNDQESGLENKLEECEMSCGNCSLTLNLSSSLSTLCEDSEFRGIGNLDDTANRRRKAGIFEENSEFQRFLENPSNKICDPLFGASPNSNVSLGEGNSSVISLGCLSSGNLIQTPNSYEYIRMSNVEADETSFVRFELDSITESVRF